MDATTLVGNALVALGMRDLEGHLLYFADDLVMGEGFAGPHLGQGKAAYRALVEQFNQLPEGTGLVEYTATPMPDTSTDDLVWVHAVIRVRNVLRGPDGENLPSAEQAEEEADWFFAVQDDKIKIIKGFARPKVLYWTSDGS